MRKASPYIIIWRDSDAANLQNTFRERLNRTARTFTSVPECFQFIQSHPCQPIYLIVSGSFAKEIVPQIYELPQLLQIYLFCGSMSAYTTWAVDYIDKILMFDHGDDVLERMWNDIQTDLRLRAASFLEEADACKQRAAQYRQSCG